MQTTMLPRRSFLVGAGLAAAWAAFLSLREGEASEPSTRIPSTAGMITQITAPSRIELATPAGSETIAFAPSPTFNRDGPARLADFQPGDHVVAEFRGGRRRGATHLEILYRTIRGRVVRLDPARIETEGGSAIVVPDTAFYRGTRATLISPSAVRKNGAVVVAARFDSARADWLARQVILE